MRKKLFGQAVSVIFASHIERTGCRCQHANIADAAPPVEKELVAMIAQRTADLVAYQDADYAQRYATLLPQTTAGASMFGTQGDALVRAVAVNAYKLRAIKDEIEVARLYVEPTFREALQAQFSSVKRISIYLAPPLLSRPSPRTGRPRKRKFGPWIFKAMALLAHGENCGVLGPIPSVTKKIVVKSSCFVINIWPTWTRCFRASMPPASTASLSRQVARCGARLWTCQGSGDGETPRGARGTPGADRSLSGAGRSCLTARLEQEAA